MKTLSHSLLFLALAASGPALAQDPHAGHGTTTSPAADPHAGHAPPKANADAHAGHVMPAAPKDDPHAGHVMPQPPAQDPHAGHDMSAMDHDAHAGHAMPAKATSAPPREPIPVPTAEDHAAAFPVLKPHAMEHAPAFNSLVVFDHLEGWDNDQGSGQSWGINAWFGNDIDRLWVRSEGSRSDGKLGDWSVDALYGRSISPWWDAVAGVRHDNGRQIPDLTRAAIGFQGMSPYKFEVSAMAYLGGTRKAELAVEAEYDVLLTNRLILQPVIEASIAADDDPRRGVGSGLGHVEAGLRLRYEITRRFAPYVGFVHERKFGRTADIHRDAGEGTRESRWVAGIRFWF
ncbi:copper resistance protein B [Stenotrophomonas sp. MH1]|uniref:Copper resistance protein B n=1 Tax=Stenotrophomonas capsici TaxID=3110230 RepID=A0ABU5V392_9GAMM|nr:copper resistance protein B [Stenotrophomonas sp. MH1]MEA5667825.1 copper resistance protein B [Stenotrophomonas sp. MH1]